MNTIAELENKLSTPSPTLVKEVAAIKGDIMILGVGGKMGPTLAKLLKRAIDQAGLQKKIKAASRFSNAKLYKELTDVGIECFQLDLLNDEKLFELPDVENVIYMAGNKFGTSGNEHFTWVMNTYLPGQVAKKYKDANIVVFSTGNVYPFVPIKSGGANEETLPSPVGEYAQSCLGRERVFEHFSIQYQTKILLFRLNYALDLRYGVLNEIGRSVWHEQAIDLTMGYVNVIWQGDANEMAIRSLLHCSSPAKVLNVTGAETIDIKDLALEFGRLMNKTPSFKNQSAETALLNDSSQAHQLFGKPSVTLTEMIEWTAHWIQIGGEEINKPTHFQERKGNF